MKTVLAFDFGASSGRAIKAVYNNGKIEYNEIHRFENIPVIENGSVFHDVPMILNEIKAAVEKAGKIDSLAFDTWGVDYGLIDSQGSLMKLPYHYRDLRTANALEKAEKAIDFELLYKKTGNQIMNINTLFQLISDDNLSKADKTLFMPDLFCWLLTGNMTCEKTIASTSQMLNPVSGKWSSTVLEKFGIDKALFPPLTPSASVNGEYKGIKVITVAGHDTQCAVAAMPVDSHEDVIFLSCGTWSLIGCELDAPVLTEQSNRAELSNEAGANGKINYLKNISGLWLIQQLKKELNEMGGSYSYNDLEKLARACTPFKCFVDPDAPSLSAHGNLIDKMKAYCAGTGQHIPESAGELARCVYESLALKYRYAVHQIKECTGKNFKALHILGGGTKDNFLCEMTANSVGIPVIAGPAEATALGNIMLQLIALGEIKNVAEGRSIIKQSEQTQHYMPDGSCGWEEAYDRYVAILKNKE